MRIVLFTETFIPKVDGIVTTLCQTVKELNRLGHQVMIVAPDGGIDAFEQSRIVRVRGSAFPLYPELCLSLPRASLRRVIEEFQPEVIHVAEPILLGVAGLYYGGGKHGGAMGLPLVVSYHTDLPKYLRYYGLGILEPFIWTMLRLRHDRATLNLCTSATMVRQLEDHQIPRVALWPGGVDADRFQPSRRCSAMRFRLTQGHPECPLLLYVGRLSVEKEIERLKPILLAVPRARLALVGDGPHRQSLRQHFAGLPVYISGFLHGDDLANAYASSDIFVMPSRTETLGLVVLEAMCSGVAVVAARAGGIPEMVEHGLTGFLFDTEGDAIGSIRQLLDSRQRLERIGRAARCGASRHSWKTATCRLLQHYRDACRMQPIGMSAAQSPRSPARSLLSAASLSVIRKLLP